MYIYLYLLIYIYIVTPEKMTKSGKPGKSQTTAYRGWVFYDYPITISYVVHNSLIIIA